MNLSGFSAVYPGYSAQENQTAQTEQNQAAAKEAAFKLLGAQVLGRALTGGQPPASGVPSQPMAPPPGQASVPNAPPAPAQPPVPSAPAPQAPPAPGPAGAPVAQGGGGLPEISLPALTQRILQTTPQVKDHPEILLAALERAAPLLDRQSKEDLGELRKQMQERSLKQSGELAQARIDALREKEKGTQGRFDEREARLAASTAVRQDQQFQRLQLQERALSDRIQQTGDKAALAQWRAVVDAQHKRAMEIIQSNSINSNLSKTDKDALLAEQRQAYEAAIAGMRQKMGSTTPTGGTVPEGAPTGTKEGARVPQNAPLVTGGEAAPPPVVVPPAILQDAQKAIAAGAPRAAVIKRLQDQGYPTDGL